MASFLILLLLQLRPAETVPFTTLSGSFSRLCAGPARVAPHGHMDPLQPCVGAGMQFIAFSVPCWPTMGCAEPIA